MPHDVQSATSPLFFFFCKMKETPSPGLKTNKYGKWLNALVKKFRRHYYNFGLVVAYYFYTHIVYLGMREGFMTLYRYRWTAARLRVFGAAVLARIYFLYAQVRAHPL